MSWHPSEAVALLARSQLLHKEPSKPSDARVVETSQKFWEDVERRKPVLSQSCPWQQTLAVEPRATRAARLAAELSIGRALHPKIPAVLKQVLASLGASDAEAADLRHLSTLRCTASTAHGSGTFLVEMPLPQPSGTEPATPESEGVTQLVLKASTDREALLQDMRHWFAALTLLGPARVPRPLLEEPEAFEGLVAWPLELVRSARALEAHRGRPSTSFADLLRAGARQAALEDARQSRAHPEFFEGLELRLAAASEDLPPVSAADIRLAAHQTAEILACLAQHPAEAHLPLSSGCATPYVSWSTSPSAPVHSDRKAQPHGERNAAVVALLSLEPMLERHLLGKAASLPRASPLHSCTRQLTEDCCLKQFGTPLTSVFESAQALHRRVQRWASAERQNSDDKLPRIEVPTGLSHGRLVARRLLLRDSGDSFDVCVSGWSGLANAPVYADCARLLTDVAFEAVKLPLFLEDIPTLFSTEGHAGVAVPPVLLAEHLGITTGAAAILLERTAAEEFAPTEEALPELFHEAALPERDSSILDLAQLMCYVRSGRGEYSAASALQVSEALVAWELPLHSRPSNKKRPVPKPTRPPPRPPDSAGHRAAQWGWQAIRELRDAAANALPAMKGDLDELWPLLWLVPSLQRSLQLLPAIHLSWMQKVWLLQHIRLLSDRLSAWLDGLETTRSLEVLLSKRQE